MERMGSMGTDVMRHGQNVVSSGVLPGESQTADRPADATFDPPTLADDLCAVRDIYVRLFAVLDTTKWDEPLARGRRGRKEWTLHETIAHLCALNGTGLESIQHTLRGEPYTFRGLDDRYRFNAWNRQGIDEHLGLPPEALFAEFMRIHTAAAGVARSLRPDQAELTAVMPIYNRPVMIVEALSIMVMHVGVIHAAQVAEPAGVPPLWTHLAPAIRHRMIGRVMRAFSLLYRRDIGGLLRTTLVFQVDGPGGGTWHVRLSPETAASGEGAVDPVGLVVHLRATDDFCRMLTGRTNLPAALLRGRLRLRGDLRMFLRMSQWFSVDARP